ncbi:MAG: DNA polymerase Y family protein [Chloroflexi bacterium]|nr:DNA polymerase Y family protein [Chloroflexota bacterium]
MRIACLFIPHFPVAVERARRPELRAQPVVIGGTPDERKVVLDCSPEAARHGVQIGMPLREALSRCREAAFLDAQHTLYRETAAAIDHALGLISPLVEPACSETFGTSIGFGAGMGQDFVGLDGLGGDELRLARAMAQAVHQAAQLTPKIGIADGKFAAFAAAITSFPRKPNVIAPGQAPGFLSRLPVTYLPISQDMQRRLALFGLRWLGQLATLPLGAVQAQFGPEGRLAWELASGLDNAPLIPRGYPTTIRERLSFPSPISSVDALLTAAQHLIARLTRRPEFARHAARGLVFKATLANGGVWERKLIFREPLATHNHILFALRGKLADLALTAAVEEIEVEFVDICGEVGLQGNLFASQRGHQLSRLDEVIRQLKSRYGRTPIAKIVEVEPWSRIPERRQALIDYDP